MLWGSETMERPRPSGDELIAASAHLHYEAWMLAGVARVLATGGFGAGSIGFGRAVLVSSKSGVIETPPLVAISVIG